MAALQNDYISGGLEPPPQVGGAVGVEITRFEPGGCSAELSQSHPSEGGSYDKCDVHVWTILEQKYGAERVGRGMGPHLTRLSTELPKIVRRDSIQRYPQKLGTWVSDIFLLCCCGCCCCRRGLFSFFPHATSSVTPNLPRGPPADTRSHQTAAGAEALTTTCERSPLGRRIL